MACEIDEASPDRGERPSGEISGAMVDESCDEPTGPLATRAEPRVPRGYVDRWSHDKRGACTVWCEALNPWGEGF